MKEHLSKQVNELSMHRLYVKMVLNLEEGARAIICNGRLIGPLDNNEEFTSEDFSLLERFSQNSYGIKLFTKLIKGQLLEYDEYGMKIYLCKEYTYQQFR